MGCDFVIMERTRRLAQGVSEVCVVEGYSGAEQVEYGVRACVRYHIGQRLYIFEPITV